MGSSPKAKKSLAPRPRMLHFKGVRTDWRAG